MNKNEEKLKALKPNISKNFQYFYLTLRLSSKSITKDSFFAVISDIVSLIKHRPFEPAAYRQLYSVLKKQNLKEIEGTLSNLLLLIVQDVAVATGVMVSFLVMHCKLQVNMGNLTGFVKPLLALTKLFRANSIIESESVSKLLKTYESQTRNRFLGRHFDIFGILNEEKEEQLGELSDICFENKSVASEVENKLDFRKEALPSKKQDNKLNFNFFMLEENIEKLN